MGNTEREEFEKNLYITYIDEVENYTYPDVIFKSIVSISMKKTNYISCIEKRWNELRNKYDVPTGVTLHFSDIKALLNPKYFSWNERERNKDMEKIFCKNNNGKEIVDTEKLYNFYQDVITIIKECSFDIIVTGKRFEKTSMSKDKSIKDSLHTEWYILFKEHLDNLGSYMLKKSYDNFKNLKKRKGKFKILTTKLRVDGDFGLSSRGDFRDVFAEVICNGTYRYSRFFTRKCFDSLKFIDKSEVGYSYISHAGNELVDFITLYAARGTYRDEFINDYMNNESSSRHKAENSYKKQIKILINDKSIYPFDEISKKIYKETY